LGREGNGMERGDGMDWGRVYKICIWSAWDIQEWSEGERKAWNRPVLYAANAIRVPYSGNAIYLSGPPICDPSATESDGPNQVGNFCSAEVKIHRCR
jgi:hypothetical protein